jgi:acetyltransferase-like isoleucine patch superfamily enzyme
MKTTRKIVNRVLQLIARDIIGATTLRVYIHRLRGVNIQKNVFIGQNVHIDSNAAEKVFIGNNTQISIFYFHYLLVFTNPHEQ